MSKPTRVGILLFDQFDLIDAGGPYEVFLTASRLSERDGNSSLYDVALVTLDGGDVTAYGGMTITSTTPVADSGPLDVLLVPGLVALATGRANSALIEAIAAVAKQTPLTASVCTGAFLLADAGLLDGLPATTHWEDVEQLAIEARVSAASDTVRWVDAGDVVTSGGLTSGMHMALHLVSRFHGEAMASRTARQLDLPWDPTGKRG